MIQHPCEIPIEDGSITLEGIISRPPGNDQAEGYAIIAHPWPALGGNMHDRIVQSLATTLLDHKIVVLAYNSRGTGGSTGKASWTGEAEKKDYASVVEWFLMHETNRDGFVGEDHHTVYCCGYSFGALAASTYLPSSASYPHSNRFSFRHILISPPVGWTATFLVPFQFGSYIQGTREVLKRPTSGSGQAGVGSALPSATRGSKVASSSTVLLVYGTKDQFSSSSDYDRYIRSITDGVAQPGALEARAIEGGDHFWGGVGMKGELMKVINAFIEAGRSGQDMDGDVRD